MSDQTDPQQVIDQTADGDEVIAGIDPDVTQEADPQ